MATDTVEDIQKETVRIQAETARLNAEIARITAERAKTAAQAAPDTTLKDFQDQTAAANAQKDLSTALTNAKIAELFGDVKAGPFKGDVDIKDKAGTIEATLFATKAVQEAGARIGEKVQIHVGQGASVLVLPARSFESFQRLISFRFRKTLIDNAMRSALPPSKAPDVQEAADATGALLSAGLDAVQKILGFFKSDFTVGGVEAKVEETAAVYAVAGAIASLPKQPKVILPGSYLPGAQMDAVQDLADEMKASTVLRDDLNSRADDATKQANTLEAQAATEQADVKAKTLAEATRLRDQTAKMKAAVTLFDNFMASLVTTDSAGVTPLVALANDLALNKKIKEANSRVLLIRLEATGGGYLIKKNLWTALGSAPLYHMGGATMSYVLLDGPEGHVLTADAVAIYGGYTPSRKVRTELGQSPRGES